MWHWAWKKLDSSAPFQFHHYLNKATSEYDIKRFKQSHVVLQKNDWLSPPLLIITGHSLDQCCQHSAQVWILEWCHCSHKHGTGCPSQAGSQPLHHGQSLCSKGKFVSETITWNMVFFKFKINGWKLIESRILLLNVLAMKYISEIPIVGQLWKWFSFQLCPKFLLAQAGKTMLIIKIIDFFLRDNISVIKNTFSFFLN